MARIAFCKDEMLWQQVCPVKILHFFFQDLCYHDLFDFEGILCSTNFYVFTLRIAYKT